MQFIEQSMCILHQQTIKQTQTVFNSFTRTHCANVRRIRCQAGLNNFPHGELEETTGTSTYYVYEDYPAGPEINEPLPE